MNSRRQTREMIQLLKKSNKDQNDIIFSYLGEGITKYCDCCEEITDADSWLIRKHFHTNKEKDYTEYYCPLCYGVCCNNLCKEIVEEETLNLSGCDQDTGVYCEECIDDYRFYCEGCEDYHCKADGGNNCGECHCDGYTECDDCESRYCFDCRCEDGIFTCEECGDSSCCRRFIKIESDADLDIRIVCEGCITYLHPNRCNKSKYKTYN